jgi:uncharacterized protein (UPF0548 family)
MSTSAAVLAPSPLHLLFPAPDLVARALAASEHAPLSYPHVGATDGDLPPGWDHDEGERRIGEGPADFDRARRAIRGWVPFALPWVRLHRPEATLRVGMLVAFSSRQFGVWTLNVCRVVRVIDEDHRFGFAYGTLAGHVVAGEERFLATLDPATGAVSFGIRKFSRPNHPLIRLAGPLARRVQRRFTVDAIDAVARAVGAAR